MCLSFVKRLKNETNNIGQHVKPSIATSVMIEMFSGFEFMSMSGLYGRGQDVFGGWAQEYKDHYLLLHLKTVPK